METLKGIIELVLFIVIAALIYVYVPIKKILWWVLEISIDIHLVILVLGGAFFIGSIIIMVIKSMFNKGD